MQSVLKTYLFKTFDKNKNINNNKSFIKKLADALPQISEKLKYKDNYYNLKIRNSCNLSMESSIKLQILTNYKNINKISKGKYIHNL